MIKSQSIESRAYPLRMAGEGEKFIIISFVGGKNFRNRIFGMGLNLGAEIDILRNVGDGPVLIALNGSRLFLGGGMSHKINVMPINGGKQGG